MSWRPIAVARQLAESELGAVHKDWGGKIPIVLAYPNCYAVGMSSLAIHGLYKWLNDLPGVVCERVFASLDRRESSPRDPLITIESQRPAREAAALMFSVSFELDYFNVVAMLRRADIPVRAAEREEGDPFIILGGPAVSANPEPLATVADAIVIGEAELILAPLAEILREAWNCPRQDTLAALSRLPGVYAPLVYEDQPIARQWAPDLNAYPLASTIVAPKAEFGDMHLIEISRGCGRGCRFCLAGYWYRPQRERSLELILRQARDGLKYSRKMGLVAAAVSDYSQIDELASRLRAMGATLSVSSLRVAPLSSTLLRALAESDSRSITFAPEAGSERLRRAINKGVTYDDILAAVRLAAEYRFESLKLYFMWGLPGETDDDIAALIALTRDIKALWPREVVANLTPFVPKAHTPYERLSMANAELLSERLARIQDGLRQTRIQVRAEAVDMARIQAILARGDRRIGEALATMPYPMPARWERALREAELVPEHYLGEQQQAALPWDFIDSHVAPGYLRSEAQCSANDKTTPPCPPHGCERCGVCTAQEQR